MIQKIFSYFSYILRPFSVLLLFLLFLIPPDLMALSPDKIAVLPFKIYMLKPMDHLVSGLQEMLTTRLAKEGFDLIDPVTINKGELSRITESELDFARGMGKEKGIDWIIKGSLTQIGKNISLDVTIIPLSTEKRPFSIFVGGDRIDKLDQIIERVAVTATNRMKGVIQIDLVSIKGNKRIETDAILAVIESQKGAKYDQDALNKDLRSIYQMGFFNDVQIDTEESPGGKSVAFKVSEKPSIGKIALLGTKKIDQKDLVDVLGIKKYSIINRKAIKDSIERLRDHYHQKGYYHVEIKESIEDLPNNEVSLIYQLKRAIKAYIRKLALKGMLHLMMMI